MLSSPMAFSLIASNAFIVFLKSGEMPGTMQAALYKLIIRE